MIPTPPTANVLNPLLWLGCHVNGGLVSTGSGVVINAGGVEYLATALHVIEDYGLNPRVRSYGKWQAIDWQTVAIDRQHDVAVLKTDTVLDPQGIPVKYGEPAGMVYGGVGYVLGFPTWEGAGGIQTNHVTEAGGRAIPIASLVVANFAASGESTYSASYINAGFSGGAVVFPLANDDWTIAGIVTHFPIVRRPVYRGCVKTGDYVLEHTGIVGYTSLLLVLDLIARA